MAMELDGEKCYVENRKIERTSCYVPKELYTKGK